MNPYFRHYFPHVTSVPAGRLLLGREMGGPRGRGVCQVALARQVAVGTIK
ncbi:MAG: hypothetical protein IJL58_04020 [Bacteroidales bacterium]|nr:hypothetical protein [Bacteroidales bacterium]